MRLAVALDLRGFVKWLPLVALGDIGFVEPLAVPLGVQREHDAVREVPVVCDGQDFAAGLFLVVGQILPKITRVGAALRRCHRVGNHLPCPHWPITHDDNTMHIVALDERGPLETNESRETSRIVERLCILDDFFP